MIFVCRKGKHGIRTNGSIRRILLRKDRRESNEGKLCWTKSVDPKRKHNHDGDNDDNDDNKEDNKHHKYIVERSHGYCSKCGIRTCWDPIPVNTKGKYILKRFNHKIKLNKFTKAFNNWRDDADVNILL